MEKGDLGLLIVGVLVASFLFIQIVDFRLTGFAIFQQDESSEFLGTFSQTFFNSSGFIQMNSTNLTGNYTSQILNAGSSSTWNTISWISDLNLGNVLRFYFNNDSSFGENSQKFYDFSGKENNGTCSGSSCPNLTTDSLFGKAYDFDGNDVITITDSSNLNPTNEISIEGWIKNTPSTKFRKTFGGSQGDTAHSVKQTSDGGLVLTGFTRSYGAGNSDFWLIKTNSTGDVEINKTFGTTLADTAYSIEETSDGGYVLFGYQTPVNFNTELWLIKTNSTGDEEWNKTFGGPYNDFGYSVQQTSDGGFVLAGSVKNLTSATQDDFWLIKTNSTGDEEWNKTFGGIYNDEALSVQQTSDGGYIILGDVYNLTGNTLSDFWLIKTNSTGDEEWNKTFGGTGTDFDPSRTVRQTSDGGYLLGGATQDYGAGDYDFWLIKTNSTGDEEWNKTFGGTGGDVLESIQQTSEGGFILAGTTSSFGIGGSNTLLIKTNSIGDQEWNVTFSSQGDFLRPSGDGAIQQTSDGGYVMAGEFGDQSSSVQRDMILIKIDPNGNALPKGISYSHWYHENISIPNSPSIIESNGGEFDDLSYHVIEGSENDSLTFSTTTSESYEIVAYKITNKSTPTNINFLWEGSNTLSDGGTGVNLSAYNWTSSSWQLFNSTTSSTETVLTGEFTSGFSNYFNNSVMWIMVASRGDYGAGESFLEGTKILMSDQSFKKIEDLEEGDVILSYDEINKKLIESKIIKKSKREIRKDAPEDYLLINSEIKVTPNHPLFSNGKWIAAGEIRIGDSLFGKNQEVIVKDIEKIVFSGLVYNLIVEPMNTMDICGDAQESKNIILKILEYVKDLFILEEIEESCENYIGQNYFAEGILAKSSRLEHQTMSVDQVQINITPPNGNSIIGKSGNSYDLQIHKDKIYGVVNSSEVNISIPDENWHHVAFTYNGSQQRLYLDGTLQSSKALSGTIGSSGSNLKIGDGFEGIIDGVSIYNRSLNGSEIIGHYQVGLENISLNFSVRSCDDVACSGESFIDILDSSPRTLSLSNNQYFQYRINFTRENSSFSPKLSLVAVSYTTPTTSSGGSGGSSGGSGGGSSSTAVSTDGTLKKTSLLINVESGKETKISTFEGTGVKEISIIINKALQTVRIEVKKYDSKPTEVSKEVSGKRYRYLQIETEDLNENLDKANVEFEVEKIWLEENNLETNEISVFKFDNQSEEWNELETKYEREDNGTYIYSIEINSFSFFAVAEKSKPSIVEEIVDTVTESYDSAKKRKYGLTIWWTLFGILAIAALFVGNLIRKQINGMKKGAEWYEILKKTR